MNTIQERIQSAKSATDWHFTLLVYGPPGKGKTYLARTAADAGHRVLLIDIEAGAMTVRGSSVDVIRVTDPADMESVVTYLRGTHPYDTVVLDSLTELQKGYVAHLKKSGDLTIRQWGQIIDWTRQLVRAFRDLACNVVVNCLSQELAEEGSPLVRVRPALHGKSLPHEIAGFFDLVGYAHTRQLSVADTDTTQTQYVLGFSGGGETHVTKDRSGKLDPVEEADLGAIIKKIGHPQPQPQTPTKKVKPRKQPDWLDSKDGKVWHSRFRRAWEASGAKDAQMRDWLAKTQGCSEMLVHPGGEAAAVSDQIRQLTAAEFGTMVLALEKKAGGGNRDVWTSK